MKTSIGLNDQAGLYAAGTAENPDARRPPHIHFDISGRINRLITQMYFPGERLNEQDSLTLNPQNFELWVLSPESF